MSRARRSAAGAVLIEALIAAVVVGIALLFLVALLAHEARLIARAAGQRDAVMLLEAALEGVRAGEVPLTEGTTTYTYPEPPWLPIPLRRGATLWIDVMRIDIPGSLEDPNLWQVKAEVRYRAGRDVLQREMTTRVWMRRP